MVSQPESILQQNRSRSPGSSRLPVAKYFSFMSKHEKAPLSLGTLADRGGRIGSLGTGGLCGDPRDGVDAPLHALRKYSGTSRIGQL